MKAIVKRIKKAIFQQNHMKMRRRKNNKKKMNKKKKHLNKVKKVVIMKNKMKNLLKIKMINQKNLLITLKRKIHQNKKFCSDKKKVTKKK